MGITKRDCDFLPFLRCFYYIAKCESVSKAAQFLGVNQPALSLQLKKLEKALGIRLFERGHAKMVLTEAGHECLEKTIHLFDIVKSMREQPDEAEDDGTFTLGAIDSVTEFLLADIIQKFHAIHPEIQPTLCNGHTSQLCQDVKYDRLDIAIVRDIYLPSNLDFVPLLETELCLVTPKNHRFNLSTIPTFDEIAACPFIAFQNTFFLEHISAPVRRAGNRLNIIQSHTSHSAVIRYVEIGLGVTILDDMFIPNDREIEKFRLGSLFPKERIGVIMRHYAALSPSARVFHRFLTTRGFGGQAEESPLNLT